MCSSLKAAKDSGGNAMSTTYTIQEVLNADEFDPDRDDLQHDRRCAQQAQGLAIADANALTKKARLNQPGFSDSRT
jgi:hypothetical protein